MAEAKLVGVWRRARRAWQHFAVCLVAAVSAASWVPALAGQSTADACVAPESKLRLDHVPIAVADLDALAETLTDGFGFSAKPGRRHANGLENLHIKFEDGSALELMTVHEPKDDVARHYADLIEIGGGGAYLALSGLSVDDVLAAAASIEPALSATRSTAFDLASFPSGHDLESIFFIETHGPSTDGPEHVTHANGATALQGVWIAVEEPQRLVDLLVELGARDCGMAGHPEHLYGRAVGLGSGTVYVVDGGLWQTDPGSAPVLSITVGASEDAEPKNLILGDAGGLWVALVPSRR